MSELVLNARHCPVCNCCWHLGRQCSCFEQPGNVPVGRGPRAGALFARDAAPDSDRDLLPLPGPMLPTTGPIDADSDGPLLLPPGLVNSGNVLEADGLGTNAGGGDDDLLVAPVLDMGTGQV